MSQATATFALSILSVGALLQNFATTARMEVLSARVTELEAHVAAKDLWIDQLVAAMKGGIHAEKTGLRREEDAANAPKPAAKPPARKAAPKPPKPAASKARAAKPAAKPAARKPAAKPRVKAKAPARKAPARKSPRKAGYSSALAKLEAAAKEFLDEYGDDPRASRDLSELFADNL